MRSNAPLRNNKDIFLAVLREGNTVTMAARAVGVSRHSAYKFRNEDEDFARAWDEALEEGTEVLENVAITRAKESSDLLLIFLLKARKPDVYREKLEVNVNWRQELRQSGIDPEQHLNALIEQARALLEQNADVIDVTASMDLEMDNEDATPTNRASTADG